MLMSEREEAEKIVEKFLKESEAEVMVGTEYWHACVEVVTWMLEQKALKERVKR